ncbi:MAG: aminotransferase class I/II-fold pyridoxal phosphate-dependent enzyme [Desulfotomaculaceae bacterium]|nr:aminotransferase class I/II-fold pyridoxal phosphate-dependent enzyme [Desulfotomaculaceae bacterium]MDD4766313.1 aminotransferase class I/II-fold pyridoxal phosphate-dependent enzyme [Desulfotomaculaceae bacterium]
MNFDQNRTPLFDAVKYHVKRNAIPLQIPGHKQGYGLAEYREFVGENVLKMDLNETRGIDMIWDPVSVIAEAEKLLAEALGANHAYFLINGTTSGVQAMIMSSCTPGDQIILPRNAHKSIFNGLILSGAKPVYVLPKIDDYLGIVTGITAEGLQGAIEKSRNAKAVMTINPSYYGVASELERIVETAHDSCIPVLVDEAHGTHMCFHPYFPISAMAAGADMSAASLHKTGGSMTQSSALLVGSSKINPNYIKQVLNLTYTSSPSYILLCSLDVARKQLAINGRQMLDQILGLVRRTRAEINKIDGLFAPDKSYFERSGKFSFDETKLLVSVQKLGLTGYEVEEILAKDYNILIELADMYNILAVISLGEKEEFLQSFVAALRDIATRAKKKEVKRIETVQFSPEVVMPPRDAFFSKKRSVPLEQCAGEIAGEMVMVYPPGIPLVSMGEIITADIIDYVKMLKEERCTIQGTIDPIVDNIMVLD